MAQWNDPAILIPSGCAIVVGLCAAYFAWQQNRTARKQLFTALYDKRYTCLTQILETITAREHEIANTEWAKPVDAPMEQAFNLSRLSAEAALLFGPPVHAVVKAIDDALHDKTASIAVARSSEGKEAHSAGMKASELSIRLLDLREDLVAAAKPYLYVGDVLRN